MLTTPVPGQPSTSSGFDLHTGAPPPHCFLPTEPAWAPDLLTIPSLLRGLLLPCALWMKPRVEDAVPGALLTLSPLWHRSEVKEQSTGRNSTPSDGGWGGQHLTSSSTFCSLDPKAELSQSGPRCTRCTLKSGLEGTGSRVLVTGQNEEFSFHTLLGCFKVESRAQYHRVGTGQGLVRQKRGPESLSHRSTQPHSQAESPEHTYTVLNATLNMLTQICTWLCKCPVHTVHITQ